MPYLANGVWLVIRFDLTHSAQYTVASARAWDGCRGRDSSGGHIKLGDQGRTWFTGYESMTMAHERRRDKLSPCCYDTHHRPSNIHANLIGGVIYTSLFSGRFDSEPRRYRFKAAAALQLASLCELLTPLAPGYFLFMASLSNIGTRLSACQTMHISSFFLDLAYDTPPLAKNMAWLTLGGTRATMNLSLCLRDNLGDVTAKAGSQNTA